MSFSYTDLEILYEDNSIIVVKKPAGIPSESSEESRMDMVRLLKNYLNAGGGTPDSFLLHRLDQPVEGIMLFGKTKKASATISADIRDRRLNKEYLAACHPMDGGNYMLIDAANENAEVAICLEDHLIKGSGNTVSVVQSKTPGAKKAMLYYSPLSGRYTVRGGSTQVCLIKVSLITGRHHQIRVQLSHTGLPIVGDRKYGCMPDGYRGMLCLAAVSLSFKHPVTREEMYFEIAPKFMEELTITG